MIYSFSCLWNFASNTNVARIKMKSNSSWRIRLAKILRRISNLNAKHKPSGARLLQRSMLTPALRLAGVIVVVALASGPLFAQKETTGVPHDWSHHHKVFSNPGTFSEAARSGSFTSWYQILTETPFTFP